MNLAKQLFEFTKELHLLYVEDDAPLRVQMSGIFSDLFKSVDTAENGKVGLEKYVQRLQEAQSPYDLVITDINMPVMNGIELIHAIYDKQPNQAIIVVSAHNESDYLIDLLQLGINSFLIKPIQHTHLLKTLYTIVSALRSEQLIKEHYVKVEQLNAELSWQKEQLKEMNKELHDKNIALEKSMRIIEGIHHKDQLRHAVNVHEHIANPNTYTEPVKVPLSKSIACLEAIEEVINDIALEYHYKSMEEISLQKLCDAIYTYTELLSEENAEATLNASLRQLADTISGPPKCQNMQNLKRTFSMLESFFFIYTKWQKECQNIDTQAFESFSSSINSEIQTLIDVWECKV